MPIFICISEYFGREPVNENLAHDWTRVECELIILSHEWLANESRKPIPVGILSTVILSTSVVVSGIGKGIHHKR